MKHFKEDFGAEKQLPGRGSEVVPSRAFVGIRPDATLYRVDRHRVDKRRTDKSCFADERVLANESSLSGGIDRRDQPSDIDRAILDVYIAATWLARLKGLFAYPHIQPHEALLIRPCSSVHTMGMRKTIDVVFLDTCGVVLKCCTLKPWSVAGSKGAHSVLEMAAGKAQQLQISVGEHLYIKTIEEKRLSKISGTGASNVARVDTRKVVRVDASNGASKVDRIDTSNETGKVARIDASNDVKLLV